MATTTNTNKEETKRNTEEYLKELIGSAALEAMKARTGYQGLCKECANREICRKRKRGEIIMSCASHNPGPPIPARAFKTFAEVLDFAIEKEEKTANFYLELAKTVGQQSTRKALKGFAKRSLKHRKQLRKMKRAGDTAIPPANVRGLKITKYVTREVSPHADMGVREVMVLAIKTASTTQSLYADLANQAEDPKIQSLFAGLAQEEAEQKLKLETEYDEHVFAQD
jgi:rubrerythrin